MWQTTPDILNRKYRKTYKMSFLAFEQLVAELTPFLRPTTLMFLMPPIPIRKQMCLVLYRLAHGFSCNAINNLYGCGKSTIKIYTLIVCRVYLLKMDYLVHTFTHLEDID